MQRGARRNFWKHLSWLPWVNPWGFRDSFRMKDFNSFMVLGETQLHLTTPKLALELDVVLHLRSPRAKLGFACAVVNCLHFADVH